MLLSDSQLRCRHQHLGVWHNEVGRQDAYIFLVYWDITQSGK